MPQGWHVVIDIEQGAAEIEIKLPALSEDDSYDVMELMRKHYPRLAINMEEAEC